MTATETTTVPLGGRAEALALYLECPVEEVSEARWGENHYDSPEGEWLVLTDDEADVLTHDYTRETVWAFRTSFLVGHMPEGLDEAAIDAMRGDWCEDVNPAILALIEAGSGFDRFAEEAISADGRGHFLAQYDGDEAASNGFYLYRTN
jgi:hypothetical protein